MPRVSVLVAAKDRPAELAEALESVAAQTYRDFEVVVVNDGGDDLSRIAAGFSDRFPLAFKRHESSRGLAAARNAGLDASSGQIITCLDDDDVLYPGHLETLVSAMDAAESKVVYTDANLAYYRQEGGKRQIVERKVIFSRDFEPGALMVYNYIPTLCLAYDRSCLGVSGRYCEELTSLVDWDLFVRLAMTQWFEHVAEITAEYRKLAEPERRDNLLAEQSGRFLYNLALLYERCSKVADRDPRITLEQAAYMVRSMKRGAANAEVSGRSGEAAKLAELTAEQAAAREDPGRARAAMRKVLERLA